MGETYSQREQGKPSLEKYLAGGLQSQRQLRIPHLIMLTFVTIVLDGEPWIERHYPVFKSLDLDWRWIICEGVAANTNCTSWCAKIEPRLSTDGTHEYIESLRRDDLRVEVISSPLWRSGKVGMCNAALALIHEPCLLWQVDSDELWTKEQIETVARLFSVYPWNNSAFFRCRYFVGPDVVTVGTDCYGNNTTYEWRRVWTYRPSQRFVTHEPPVLTGAPDRCMSHGMTESHGCVFDHMAYATEAQVAFKQRYYAGAGNPLGHLYANAVDGWRRLQQNDQWPVKLKDYMPWVDDRAQAVRL